MSINKAQLLAALKAQEYQRWVRALECSPLSPEELDAWYDCGHWGASNVVRCDECSFLVRIPEHTDHENGCECSEAQRDVIRHYREAHRDR